MAYGGRFLRSGSHPFNFAWAGDGRLRHSTITGKDLGMSVRHDKQRYERYVVHLDAEGREIAVLSMVLAEPDFPITAAHD